MALNGILKTALSLLPKEEVGLFRFKERKQNKVGLDINVYEDEQKIIANIQPIDRSRYEYMGLDGSKSYISVHTVEDISPVSDDQGADYLVWQNRKWGVLKSSNWHATSDFSGVMCMDIGAV